VKAIVLLRLLPLAVLTAMLAGCGGSAPKGPPELLFVSTRDGDYALFGSDAGGKHVRRLSEDRGDTSSPAGLFHQVEPAWSPDGSRIAFVSRRDGRFHVYLMNADGGGVRRLTNAAKDDHNPAWSPDGTRIAFGREGAMFAVPAGGGPARRLGHGFGGADDPAWSPDGKRVAYDYRVPGDRARELYVMDADGTHIRRLTKLGATSAAPAWSPDGRRIAFQSDLRLGSVEIYTVAADGSGLRQATRTSIDATQPAWSPDGGLAYASDGAIWLQTGGRDERLTSGDGNDASPAWRPAPSQ
jgi:Tol biopolymer transport system component